MQNSRNGLNINPVLPQAKCKRPRIHFCCWCGVPFNAPQRKSFACSRYGEQLLILDDRREKATQPAPEQAGPLRLDPEGQVAICGNHIITLAQLEAAVLLLKKRPQLPQGNTGPPGEAIGLGCYRISPPEKTAACPRKGGTGGMVATAEESGSRLTLRRATLDAFVGGWGVV